MTISFKDFNKQINEEVELTLEQTQELVENGNEDLDRLISAHQKKLDKLQPGTAKHKEYTNHLNDLHLAKKSGWEAVWKKRGMSFGKANFQKLNKEEVELEEALKGNQDKLDVDHDGKIERSDLKKLRSKKDEIIVNKGQQVKEGEGCGKKMYREFVEEIQEIVEAKKDDYWDFKDLKDKEKNQPTSRKVAGTRYGGSAQKDEPEDDDNDDKPAVKRGRGRPAGSKSGARQKGNGNNYGGLAIHSLNLPSKK